MTDADWIAELGGDWQYEVDPETVTLRVKTGEGEFTPHTVNYAKRRVRSRGHDELVSLADLTWHLWASQLPAGVEPKEHDEIVDAAGDTWVIQRTRLEYLDTRHRCETTKL